MLKGAPVEETRSGETPIPRGSPLPWLLLVLTLMVAVAIFSMARTRLAEEKLRTANALKANDEVLGRLRNVVNEQQRVSAEVSKLTAAQEQLQAKLKTSESALGTCTAELEAAQEQKSKLKKK